MINQELIKYIEFHLQDGSSWEKIKSDLMAAGWPADAIEENYAQVAKPKPAEQIKPIEPITEKKPISQNSIDRFREAVDDAAEDLSVNEPKPLEPAASFTEWAGAKESIQPPAAEPTPFNLEQPKPIMPIEAAPLAQPQIERFEKPKKSSTGLIIGIIVLLLVLLAGGGAFAYYQYVYPQQIMATAIKNIASISNDKYVEITALTDTTISGEQFACSYDECFNSIALKMNLKTDLDLSDANNLKVKTTGTADFVLKPTDSSLAANNLSTGFEAIGKDNNFYFKTTKLQGIENDLIGSFFHAELSPTQYEKLKPSINQNLINQWIALPANSINSIGGETYSQSVSREISQVSALLGANRSELEKTVQFKVLGSEKVENDDCFKYQITFNKEGTQALLQKLDKNNTPQVFEQIVWPIIEKIDLQVSITKNNPYLRKFKITFSDNKLNLAPLESISSSLEVTYKKMAAGSISVTTPENSKPIEDVVNSIFEQAFPGQSAITVMADAKIQLDADKLKLLAETYKSSNSTYLNFTAKDEGSALVKDMNSVGGKAAFIFIVKDKYCLTKELVGEKGTYWCIDNSGYAGVSTNCTKKTYSCK